jgi:hypothetical protein
MSSGPFTVLLLVPPGALSPRRLNQAAAAANLQQSEAGARWGGLESNSIPTEHDREVVCLGSEHEKDAERGREDAERASKHVEQSLAKRGNNICVSRFGKKAERNFEGRLGLVFGEPEKNNNMVEVTSNFPQVSLIICSTLRGLRSTPYRTPGLEWDHDCAQLIQNPISMSFVRPGYGKDMPDVA